MCFTRMFVLKRKSFSIRIAYCGEAAKMPNGQAAAHPRPHYCARLLVTVYSIHHVINGKVTVPAQERSERNVAQSDGSV